MSVLETMHRQVHISHGGREADVDEGLADTILALWRAGFETEWSCQGLGHLSGLYEAPFIIFAHKYPPPMQVEIEEILNAKGWVVLDVFAWDSHGARPVRTMARFVRPGTVI